jgi:hypothetical protein
VLITAPQDSTSTEVKPVTLAACSTDFRVHKNTVRTSEVLDRLIRRPCSARLVNSLLVLVLSCDSCAHTLLLSQCIGTAILALHPGLAHHSTTGQHNRGMCHGLEISKTHLLEHSLFDRWTVHLPAGQ